MTGLPVAATSRPLEQHPLTSDPIDDEAGDHADTRRPFVVAVGSHGSRTSRAFGAWLAQSPVPKLFINAGPGALLTGRARDICRHWPNQQEITVRGVHYVQEDSPAETGPLCGRSSLNWGKGCDERM